MKEYKQYLNGKYVNESELLISPRDLGFTRSYAVFDYIRTYNGKPFKLIDHIERLIESSKLIKIEHSYTVAEIENVVLNLLEINNDGLEKSIKIIMSGGVSNSMYQTSSATLVIYIDPFKPKNPDIYTKGVRLKSIKYTRDVPESKNTNYLEGVMQAQVNKDTDIYEPLYFSDSQVFETSNSNIFVVKDNVIYTPKNNIFLGAARGVVVNDLKNKFQIIEQDFDLNFLLNADEVFLTSSGKEVVSVVCVDDIIIGDGKVGVVGELVLKEFRDFVNVSNF